MSCTTSGQSIGFSACAKLLTDQGLCYYLTRTSVTIGSVGSGLSNIEGEAILGLPGVDISPQHVHIQYDHDLQIWTLECLSKNNCRVDDLLLTQHHAAVPLTSRTLIQIGNRMVYFLLPVGASQHRNTYGSESVPFVRLQQQTRTGKVAYVYGVASGAAPSRKRPTHSITNNIKTSSAEPLCAFISAATTTRADAATAPISESLGSTADSFRLSLFELNHQQQPVGNIGGVRDSDLPIATSDVLALGAHAWPCYTVTPNSADDRWNRRTRDRLRSLLTRFGVNRWERVASHIDTPYSVTEIKIFSSHFVELCTMHLQNEISIMIANQATKASIASHSNLLTQSRALLMTMIGLATVPYDIETCLLDWPGLSHRVSASYLRRLLLLEQIKFSVTMFTESELLHHCVTLGRSSSVCDEWTAQDDVDLLCGAYQCGLGSMERIRRNPHFGFAARTTPFVLKVSSSSVAIGGGGDEGKLVDDDAELEDDGQVDADMHFESAVLFTTPLALVQKNVVCCSGVDANVMKSEPLEIGCPTVTIPRFMFPPNLLLSTRLRRLADYLCAMVRPLPYIMSCLTVAEAENKNEPTTVAVAANTTREEKIALHLLEKQRIAQQREALRDARWTIKDRVLFVKFVTSLGHPPDWSAAVRVHPMWLSLASKTEEQLEAYYCELIEEIRGPSSNNSEAIECPAESCENALEQNSDGPSRTMAEQALDIPIESFDTMERDAIELEQSTVAPMVRTLNNVADIDGEIVSPQSGRSLKAGVFPSYTEQVSKPDETSKSGSQVKPPRQVQITNITHNQLARMYERVLLLERVRVALISPNLRASLVDANVSGPASWWLPRVHDVLLMVGVCKHGVGQWTQIWTDAEFAVLHSQQPKLSARELAVLCVMERRVTDRLAYLCTMAETTSSSIVSEADSISVYDELRAAGSLQLDITLDEGRAPSFPVVATPTIFEFITTPYSCMPLGSDSPAALALAAMCLHRGDLLLYRSQSVDSVCSSNKSVETETSVVSNLPSLVEQSDIAIDVRDEIEVDDIAILATPQAEDSVIITLKQKTPAHIYARHLANDPAHTEMMGKSNRARAQRLEFLQRDAEGQVVFPLQVNERLIVVQLGHVISDRERFHNARAFFPVDYISMLWYISVVNPERNCWYFNVIRDTGAISPTYMVICEDCKDEPFFATSSSNVWGQIDTRLKRAVSKRARGNVSASGVERYGLNEMIVADLLMQQSKSKNCTKFVGWTQFQRVLTDTLAIGPSASAHGGGDPAKQRQRNMPKRHRAVNLPPVHPTVEPPLLEPTVVKDLNIFETDSVSESKTAVEL